MCDRCFPCKRILIVLLLSILACGCAGKAVRGSGIPPKSLGLTRTIHETDRIVATARFDLTTAQGHYPIKAALILQKPSYFRLEVLPVIGTPDFFLAASSDEMRIFIPSQGAFYAGKPSAENLARFLPLAFNIEDIVTIFFGAYPPLTGNKLSYESYIEDHLLRVLMTTSAGASQTVWMNKNGTMAKLIRNGTDGKEIYQVLYEDYEPASRLPGKIIIEMADHITSVTAKLMDVRIEKATDLSVFALPVPAGMKIIKLD